MKVILKGYRHGRGGRAGGGARRGRDFRLRNHRCGVTENSPPGLLSDRLAQPETRRRTSEQDGPALHVLIDSGRSQNTVSTDIFKALALWALIAVGIGRTL